MTHQKRLPAPKHYPIQRKEGKYISTIEGSRSKEDAIPAVVLLRDVLGYADNKTEAKKIVRDGQLLRNGDKIRDIREGIGILDVFEIPETEEAYRVIRDGKDLEFVPVTDEEKAAAKIVGKETESDENVYRLHNGENHRTEKEYNTGNTLVFNSSVTEVELEEGARVLVMDGKHAGKTSEIEEIQERGMKADTAVVEEGFETRLENLVAVENLQLGENR